MGDVIRPIQSTAEEDVHVIKLQLEDVIRPTAEDDTQHVIEKRFDLESKCSKNQGHLILLTICLFACRNQSQVSAGQLPGTRECWHSARSSLHHCRYDIVTGLEGRMRVHAHAMHVATFASLQVGIEGS